MPNDAASDRPSTAPQAPWFRPPRFVAMLVVAVGLVLLGWLSLSPPTFDVASTGDAVACRPLVPIGAGPVLLERPQPGQIEARDHYVEERYGDLGYTVDELRAKQAETTEAIVDACHDARLDRLAALTLGAAAVVGALVLVRASAARDDAAPHAGR